MWTDSGQKVEYYRLTADNLRQVNFVEFSVITVSGISTVITLEHSFSKQPMVYKFSKHQGKLVIKGGLTWFNVKSASIGIKAVGGWLSLQYSLLRFVCFKKFSGIEGGRSSFC